MGIQRDKEKDTEQFVRNCLKVSLPKLMGKKTE